VGSLQEKAREQLGQQLAQHEASVRYRVRTLAQMINDRIVNTNWRALADRIVARVPERNAMGELSAIYRWVKKYLRFTRDPDGFDVFYTPRVALLQRSGDCDEHTVIIGLLAKSLGYPVKIRAVSLDGMRFSHVYPLADATKRRGGGKWVALDAVFARGPGVEPRHEKRMDVGV
jgi:hypothetical protein